MSAKSGILSIESFRLPQIKIMRKDTGFTLLELMVAMVIFSIGILAVGAMQITSTNSNASARIQTEEYTWVVDQIERLTALDYDLGDLTARGSLGCPGPLHGLLDGGG